MKRLDDLIDMYQNFANSIRDDLKTKSKRAEYLIKHDRIHRLCDEFPGYFAYIMWLMLKEKRKDIKIIEAIAIHMRKKLLSL
ncbi:hypothetical protein THOM_2028 [Trachipleistophora hominis]|uniref:Uncharacterized protein n=1 Tax=Trachipleistophora hominis TaxID=72359 RepID=L7JU90_TRAHO|nr:hypothetical protein THOM_2028 [Trachipleistophora hominis]